LDGKRGRLTSTPDRQLIIELVNDTIKRGASKVKSCEIVGIAPKTLDRWISTPEDLRHSADRPEPKNKLTLEEEQEIIKIINSRVRNI